jgi:protein required for attachment to host cells
MTRILVLVAESSRARVYLADTPSSPLNELQDLVNPEGRLHEGDLVAASPGSDGGSSGQGRHIMNSRSSAHKAAQSGFARQLVDELEQKRNAQAFDQLVLVAPPAFLGELRSTMPKALSSMVTEELSKNLVAHSTQEVRDHLKSLH